MKRPLAICFGLLVLVGVAVSVAAMSPDVQRSTPDLTGKAVLLERDGYM